jgi:4-hydroxymandelate oxidase
MVFRSGPPRPQPGGPLRLAGSRRQLFDTASTTARDPRLQVYMSDMVAPYGLAYHDEVRQAGLGQSYAEMCQPLVESLVPADEPIDLLVLAFGLHDLRPGQASSIYLGHVCPGDPLALSVCDQGSAAPFTALRLIQTYARTGNVRRALLLVAEQGTVHYDLPRPAPLPQRQAAVALLLDADAGLELAPVRQRSGVPPAQLRSALAAELAAIGDPAGRTLLLGARLAAEDVAGIPADAVLPAPAGQPCSGAWWQLAEEGGQSRPGQLVVVDYEPDLGYLSVAALQPARQPAGIGA